MALVGLCDVICEKPMPTDSAKCRAILNAVKRTGRNVRVAFNMRYSPVLMQVKELLQSGVIGNILSVEFRWLLNTRHGADYFRRWHRNRTNSGGLMAHKATHHFDVVNGWINSAPKTVCATGTRQFYTPEQAERYGLTRRGERRHGCPESARCPFCLDLAASPSGRDCIWIRKSMTAISAAVASLAPRSTSRTP
ncbi:MAG: Gfo/Idh/MocA family oxidoreductase [Kiritimatiellia bacterium]